MKIDLLGNRSLGVIRDAIANVRQNGIAFDERSWEPEDDAPTRRAVAEGRTMGCFYIESPAMRLLQQKTGVGDFEHLVIHSSIIRPAEGARDRGLTDGQIDGIWRMIMSFNGYSFCKPHSTSYARISFQAAYLKTHFPAEFMAAVIGNQGGFYSPFAYVSEAKRLGVHVLPPDVSESRIRWTGRDRKMRVGLLSVKGLSAAVQARIVSEREQSPFTDINDFLDRVRPDEDEARALIHSGALDRFHPQRHRAALVWQFCAWQKRRSRSAAMLPLFSRREPMMSPDLPADPPLDRLRREFKVLGFLCDRHPMTLFEGQLSAISRIKAADLPSHLKRHIRVAGWLITGKTVMTHNGDPMKFITFEDETGLVESVFFPKAYRSFCHMLDYGLPYLISGKVEANWGVATLTVDFVRLLRPGSP